MSLKKFFLATTLALASSTLLADGVSYDYAQLTYEKYSDLFSADVNADGFGIEGSFSLDSSLYLRGEFLNGDVDNAGDVDRLRLNLGYHMPISRSTDFVAEIGYEDFDAGLVDDSGFNALVGLRGMAANNFELGGYAQYSDVNESTDLVIEGRYHFDSNLSVAVELGKDSELEDHYGVNLRYSF